MLAPGPLVLLAFGALAPVEPLQRVLLPVGDGPAAAAWLEAGGYDVVEGSVRPGSIEAVVTGGERARLEALGYAPVLLEVGRPLAGDEAVPAGYPDLQAIEASLAATAAAHPSIARLVDLTANLGVAPTVDGNHLLALKISDNAALDEDEPAALVVSDHHAREIVTPVLALDAIARLTAGYGLDPRITAVVDAYEIWIAPVWNPDGYRHVFEVDNLWRKNRRPFASAFGVDLNRNYPLGWSASCAGSGNPASATYKGPAPASEAETGTMLAFAGRRRFAKVLDFHSTGRETLWAYQCLSHPWDAHLAGEARALAEASGYAGANRRPSAEGEHYEWQLASFGSLAMLTETAAEFQPPYAEALAEASLVWPGTLWLLERPISLHGHVRDACTGLPLAADITWPGTSFPNGERNASFLPFGRFHAFPPAGTGAIEFAAPGYLPERRGVTVAAATSEELAVSLVPIGGCGPACVVAELSARQGLVGAKDGALGAAFRWEPDPRASSYHLLSVAAPGQVAGDLSRLPPLGGGRLECASATPACGDDDARAAADTLYYQVRSACGPDAASEGP